MFNCAISHGNCSAITIYTHNTQHSHTRRPTKKTIRRRYQAIAWKAFRFFIVVPTYIGVVAVADRSMVIMIRIRIDAETECKFVVIEHKYMRIVGFFHKCAWNVGKLREEGKIRFFLSLFPRSVENDIHMVCENNGHAAICGHHIPPIHSPDRRSGPFVTIATIAKSHWMNHIYQRRKERAHDCMEEKNVKKKQRNNQRHVSTIIDEKMHFISVKRPILFSIVFRVFGG